MWTSCSCLIPAGIAQSWVLWADQTLTLILLYVNSHFLKSLSALPTQIFSRSLEIALVSLATRTKKGWVGLH